MKAFSLTTPVALGWVALALWAGAPMSAPAATGQIAARPLTHQEIADLNLPEGTRVSGGLMTVGLGMPVYLEAQVDQGTAVSNVVWTLVSQPAGSTAALSASPLDLTVPIYNPGDREVFAVAGRQLLIPDTEGQYTVRATVSTEGGDLVLNGQVTAGTYVQFSTCAFCHNGGFLPDKVTPWSGTGHARFFTEAIDGLESSHYNADCIQCHTVGYDPTPGADNNGFDDIARELGWTFPETLQPGNWDTNVPARLKGVANIQCENCHGPGSQHAGAFGNTDFISVSYSSGDCGQCHDDQPYHIKNQEWNNSKHAVATRYPTGEDRAACVICHSGIGFIDRIDGAATVRTDYEAITCSACHDPHDATNPHQIRTLADVTLMDGLTTITNGGKGKLCMNCHMSRRDAVDYVQSYHSHYGPHHGPQADMLAGANAITYGKIIPSSSHLAAVPDACVTCHLQETAAGDPAHLNAGGHTFKPDWDGGTPEDPSDDVDLVGACWQCHGPIASFDFPRQDYDGDGVIEGVQSEVDGLLHDLGLLLPPVGDPAVTVTEAYTPAELKAAYNYFFVEEDGSHGVHNLDYAVGLLRAAQANLLAVRAGDEDEDGLADAWEIAQFGSITAYDGQADPDDDGVNNAQELAQGTNPLASDSDNDGFTDRAEIEAGADPLEADDHPEFVIQALPAAEFEFASEAGKSYQVQMATEGAPGWQAVGDPLPGTGGLITNLIPRQVDRQEYYRVIELP